MGGARSLRERIVLGTWGLATPDTDQAGGASHGYGPMSDNAVDEVLDAAWELGVRQLDVMETYGGGTGIKRLASWQRRRGVNWTYMLKVGRPILKDGPVTDLRPESMLGELSRAMDALGVHPSAILLKDPPAGGLADGTLNEHLELLSLRSGTPVGISTHLTEIADSILSKSKSLLQIEYNGIQARRTNGLAKRAMSFGWRVLAMQPMAYGWLAHGPKGPELSLGIRSKIAPETVKSLSTLSELFFSNVRVTEWKSERPTLALAFSLASPYVDSVVIGPRRAVHLSGIKEALELSATRKFRAICSDLACA